MREIEFIAYDTEHDTWMSSEDIALFQIDELSTDGYVKYLQYSGFKDKDGKKIFDGHICRQGKIITKVKFRYGCFFLCAPDDNGVIMSEKAADFHCLAHQYQERKERPFCKLEIIGHVLTNPELLNKTS